MMTCMFSPKKKKKERDKYVRSHIYYSTISEDSFHNVYLYQIITIYTSNLTILLVTYTSIKANI